MLDFQEKLLKRADEICGGRSALRRRLGVKERSLQLWLARQARLPESVFLKAVDIVLEDDIARAAEDRRAAPRAVLVDPNAPAPARHV